MPRTSASAGVSRRTVLRTTALGALATAAGVTDVDDVFGQARQAPPNIVFIMADDLGYADVGCYGRPDFKTPNIDRIAARGVRFLQGYANSAVCSATRTALITGRYQYRLRVGLEEPLGGNTDVGLPPEHPTLPSLLKTRRLRHDAHRQVAPRRAAQLRPAQERLRPFLRLPRRRRRLLPHTPAPARTRTSGTTTCRSHQIGLPDGAASATARWTSSTATRRRGSRSCSACTSTRRTGRGKRPATRRNPSACARGIAASALRRRHAEDLSEDDRGDGRADRPRPQGARRQPPHRQHHRHLHERQRRRALRGYVAVHRPEDRAARRRAAHSVDRLVAGADSAGQDERSGVDHDGLDADAAGGGRCDARSGAAARRHQPAAAS